MAGPLTTPILEALDLPGPDGLDEVWDEISSGHLHYDREGQPITMREWAALFEYKPYQVVERTDVGGLWVSTVWLGLDHSFGRGRPLIFETMVFESELSFKKPSEFFPEGFTYYRDFEQQRWASEEEAQKGHWSIVEEVRLLASALPDSLPTVEEQP